MLRHIELGQVGNVDFLGHDFAPSKVFGQGDGRRNISLLGGLVASAKHHNQYVALLHVVHAPARAEKLAHLKHAFTNGATSPSKPRCTLFQPTGKTAMCHAIFQTDQPLRKFRKLLDDEHGPL
jgi:hypothetical protein